MSTHPNLDAVAAAVHEAIDCDADVESLGGGYIGIRIDSTPPLLLTHDVGYEPAAPTVAGEWLISVDDGEHEDSDSRLVADLASLIAFVVEYNDAHRDRTAGIDDEWFAGMKYTRDDMNRALRSLEAELRSPKMAAFLDGEAPVGWEPALQSSNEAFGVQPRDPS
jgi:hypothetical protein